MNLFGYEISLRKDKPETLASGEIAWSQDAGRTQFNSEKYNPDDLIGRKGAAIYRRMMQDEQVKAVVRFKRDAITSRAWSFEVDREALGDKEADKRVTVFNAIIGDMRGSFTDALNGIMTSMYQGMSMTEKMFHQFEIDGKTYWGIRELKLRPYDTFKFVVDAHGVTERVIQRIGSLEQEIDIDKFIHFTHNPEYDEHYGQSELNECYRAWFSKDNVIAFWNIWLERSASGFKWITPMKGKTLIAGSAEYLSLQNVLNNTVNGTGMILPGNIELHLEFPSDNVAFKEAMETHDLSISRALLVPNLMGITPSGQTGSFSQSETQLTAFFWTLHTDTKRLEEALNEQLFRQLGVINFGDEMWPRIKFNPLTDAQINSLLDAWSGLLDKSGVTRSDADEAYVRELMGFPNKAPDDLGTNAVNEKQALNGAQVTSLVEVVSKVTTGELSETAAMEIIVAAFPISRDTATQMLKDRGTAAQGVRGPDNVDKPVIEDDQEDKPMPNEAGDESIVQRQVINIAFTRAQKRVDFTVIANTSQDAEDEHAEAIAEALFDSVSEYIVRLELEYPTWEADDVPRNLRKMKFNSQLLGKTNKAVAVMFRVGWRIGIKHATIEIDKAKRTTFSAKIDDKRIQLISEDFFKLKAFKVAGDLSADALKKIESIILSAAATGRTVAQIKEMIYAQFASYGLLPHQVAEALGVATEKGIKNPQARINTMVRTNLFSSINEARYSYFTDPALDGFVEALEYSAILDVRTTTICQHLDGQIHAADSDVWQQYRPPNHFNCRSLLIPVTVIDTWSESDEPILEPQRGFA